MALREAAAGYLDHLAVERGTARNTLDSYKRDLRRYSEHLARMGVASLADVTEPHVTEFLAALREGDSDHPPLAASSAPRYCWPGARSCWASRRRWPRTSSQPGATPIG